MDDSDNTFPVCLDLLITANRRFIAFNPVFDHAVARPGSEFAMFADVMLQCRPDGVRCDLLAMRGAERLHVNLAAQTTINKILFNQALDGWPFALTAYLLPLTFRLRLVIIAEDIEDNPANFTRFLVVQPHGTAPTDANRTSLVITTNHTPGALAGVLTLFAKHNINLSKLQSRPIIGQPWRYRFYLVLDAAGEQLRTALKDIEPLTESLTILGEYRHNL